MKAKKGFNLREVCGEQIIVAEGKENIDFSNIISMNESSAYLWKKVQQMESFTADDLAQLLTEQYEVEYEVALKDATTLADQWVEAGIVEL
jgi:ABC-type enterochelin transport system permease subunit